MSISLFNRLEQTTDSGTLDFTTGANAWTLNTANATFDPAANLGIGTNGLRCAGSAARASRNPATATAIFTPAQGVIQFMVRFDATLPTSGQVLGLLCRGTSGSDICQITRIATSAGWRFTLGRSSPSSTHNLDAVGTGIAAATTYVVQVAWNSATNFRQIRIKLPNGTAVASAVDSSTNWSASVPVDLNQFRLGDSAGYTGTHYFKNAICSTLVADADEMWARATVVDYPAYVAAGGITGTLAATEGQDVAAIAGAVRVAGALAVTEGQDVAAIAGRVRVLGTLAVTEGQDVAAIAGAVRVAGAMAVTEAQDVAAIAGAVRVAGALSVTEAQDVAFINGAAPQPSEGFLAVVESQDVAAIVARVRVTGALAVTEAQDVAFISAIGPTSGYLAVTEAQDVAAIFGDLETCDPYDFDPRAPSIDDLLGVAYLDRHGRFAKDPDEVATVRLFYGLAYCPPYSDLTRVQYRALSSATRLALEEAPSGAGFVDTEGKSNA